MIQPKMEALRIFYGNLIILLFGFAFRKGKRLCKRILNIKWLFSFFFFYYYLLFFIYATTSPCYAAIWVVKEWLHA